MTGTAEPGVRQQRWLRLRSLVIGAAGLTALMIWVGLIQVVPLLSARRFRAFRIPSASMEPTFLVGDFLFVKRTVDARSVIQDGAVVVFQSVEEPDLAVMKRVVGVPGDTLEMRAGALWRNGARLPEEFVAHREPSRSEDAATRLKMREWQLPHVVGANSESYQPDVESWGPVVVSPDSFFALGDNRDNSYDSRYFGFVPMTNVSGTPGMIYWSYGLVADSASGSHVRWSRIGHRMQ